MTQPITNELMYEVLKRLQADVADVKRDIRDLKASVSMILSVVGDLVKATARNDERFASLEVKVERIEHRLDLHDHPSA